VADDPVPGPAAPAASPPQLASTAGRGEPQVGAQAGVPIKAQSGLESGLEIGPQRGPRVRPTAVKSPKAPSAGSCQRLEDLPNIGPAMAADLRAMGITHPRDLAHRDAFVLYQSLCALSGKRQDPCVLDTFMAATDFMRGAAPAPWWAYTAQRKLLYGAV
jgi:predicted flap endonuclease-1-like 5' DNA nuclease